jgi:hypothetical protein
MADGQTNCQIQMFVSAVGLGIPARFSYIVTNSNLFASLVLSWQKMTRH